MEQHTDGCTRSVRGLTNPTDNGSNAYSGQWTASRNASQRRKIGVTKMIQHGKPNPIGTLVGTSAVRNIVSLRRDVRVIGR
jgi:hypothetical protein